MKALQLILRKVTNRFPPLWGELGRELCGLLLLFAYCQLANAQLFPVQANPQLIPPYSLKLSDYATTTSEKLLLNLLLTDVNEADLQVRLRFSIQGGRADIRSTDFVQDATPIRLAGGVPLRLSNLDLRPYFDLRNLQGITPQQYNTPLPDGLYQFCFEVFDWVTGQRLSQKRCIPVYLILNAPPFLNLPQRGELVTARNPQNIIFQWTPRHVNATGVQYEFELRELWDTQIDPQASFLTSPNLYRTTTFATTLLYGPGETTLLNGKTYGWRVRALVSDGIGETSVFRNNGYSEIFHFTYTGQCEAPRFVLAKSQGTTTEAIRWQQNPDHIQYQVQYRKKGASGSIWFEQETTGTTKKLFFLEPDTTYEFRVGGQCLPNGGYSFSQINTFTTPSREEASTYNCGIPPEILITNQKPIGQLGVNDVFTAGDFPVTIQEVYGGNGTFSGWGFIVVPYLADTQIRVGFENIRINTDKQLIDGVVETAYDVDFATAEGNAGIDDIRNELEVLGEFADLIVESLNLDISKDTKEKVNQVVDAMMANMNDEDLPEELVAQVEAAATIIKEAKERYDTAVSNSDTGATDIAQKDFKSAQDNLADTEKEIGKYKKEVADFLKEAIVELYREGRDIETSIYEEYTRARNAFQSKNIVDDSQFFFIDEVYIVENPSSEVSDAQKELNEIEKRIGIYLFAKILTEDDADGTKLDIFIEDAKKSGTGFYKEIARLKEERKKKNEIITFLKGELMISFTSILVDSLPEF